MKRFYAFLMLILFTASYAADYSIDFAEDLFPKVEQNGGEKVLLTPNPANSYTQLVVDKGVEVKSVIIYSVLGNQIFAQNYNGLESKITLNVQSFKKGKYLLQISFKDGTSEVKSLIKQ